MAGKEDGAGTVAQSGADRLQRVLDEEIARLEAGVPADEAAAARRVRQIEAIAKAGRAIAMMRLAAARADKAVREATAAGRRARAADRDPDTEESEMDEPLTPEEAAELERRCQQHLDDIAANLELKRALRRQAAEDAAHGRNPAGGVPALDGAGAPQPDAAR